MSEIAASLAVKLHPSRFTAMSGKMAAIVGCILGEEFTDPRITELVVTRDGGVLASTSVDPFMNEFIGSETDLKRNWKHLLKAADLTKAERQYANKRYSLVIRRA